MHGARSRAAERIRIRERGGDWCRRQPVVRAGCVRRLRHVPLAATLGSCWRHRNRHAAQRGGGVRRQHARVPSPGRPDRGGHHCSGVVAELSGLRWPRIVLIGATVLPNVWLTVVGHNSTNYLWLPLLVAWVAFAGTAAESIVALVGAGATVGLAVVLVPSIGWAYWVEWFFSLVWRRSSQLKATTSCHPILNRSSIG